ncbi:MAG: cobalamin-binding protein [Sulfuricaulis sp.]
MAIDAPRYPRRIVCLTEETTETLYLLGEQDRIVGISGFTVRPPQARKEKPKISAFTSAKIDKILALEPDLVLGFSNLQANIAAELIRAGVAVHVFNQRSVTGIFGMITMLGAMIGESGKAEVLCTQLHDGLARIQEAAAQLPRKPKIYFEEWDEPLISGIGWVSELIHLAGGEDCFPELGKESSAKRRIIADPSEVIRRAPDIVLGSWCGKRFRPEQLCARPGWEAIPAVRHGQVFEIKSPDILQPGPAPLTDGVKQIHTLVRRWAEACA